MRRSVGELPRRFFGRGVAPGDQAPALSFAVAVTLAAVGGRLLVAPATLSGYARVAEATASPYLTAAVVLGVAAVLVAPLVLHLGAALATLGLAALVDERAGVSETVQVIAYAAAPGVFVAVPRPAVRVAALAYACVLFAVGLAVVHGTSRRRAALAAALPALFVFGLAFGGIAALDAVIAGA
ncbi:hypothetical protein BRC75_08070 [Halobacteriales archaeon QH_7_69_31]|nr:MAG: hypothetical protein BRC75_08070 [Halobacteriales archaeon QH_7_69_31]